MTQEVIIPDEAIIYIVNNFFLARRIEGVQIVRGISDADVELVLNLLIKWADTSGYVKNNILTLGGIKID